MQRPLVLLLTLLLAFKSGPVFGEEDDKSGTESTDSSQQSQKRLSAIPPKTVITLQSQELAKNGSLIDAEIRKKCEQTDYRSYIECLLRETKRKKRQCPNGFCSGYQQCFGAACFPVVQPQLCPGSGCIQVQQQQPCLGSGCIQVPQQQQQQCSGFGCVFIGYTCYGSGCIQIGQTCYGIGCVPGTNCPGNSCSSVQENGNNTLGGNEPAEQKQGGGGGGEKQQPTVIYEGPTAEDLDDLRTEIEDIRDQLKLVKEQNDRLIDITEKATTLILAASNKPATEIIRREPVLLTHNLTTNIDISNYLNNTNVINLPEIEIGKEKNHTVDDRVPLVPVTSGRLQELNPSEKEEQNRNHCCVVVRPKTCRTISRPPYFTCGNRKHRTCGRHCGGKRLVHSIVKPECGWNSTESCVSYHSAPYAPGVYPGYSGYPGYPGYPGGSGYYPPTPAYYPFLGTAYYPVYAPPPMPIYPAPPLPIYPAPPMYHSAPPPYPPTVETDEEVLEECEDCGIETEILTQECDETIIDCKSTVEKKQQNEPGNEKNSSTETPRGDTLPLDLNPIAEPEDDDGDDGTGSRSLRSNPLVALREVEKEAAAIKRSENQLEASLDMLQEAVELKRLEGEKNKEEVKGDKSVKDVEPISASYTTASNIEP